jgi:hypothetical protein
VSVFDARGRKLLGSPTLAEAPSGVQISRDGRRAYPAPIETVNQKSVLSDGVRTMDIYHVQDMSYTLQNASYRQGNHSEDTLMAYLPKEKMLVNADLYSPPAPGQQPPLTPTPSMLTLYQNIHLLKLDVERHVPIHGRVGTQDEFLKIIGTIPALASGE